MIRNHRWPFRVRLRDLVREASAAFFAHGLQATLSATGIVFGVATVVTAIAIAEGARNAALEEIGALGIDNVFVRALPATALAERGRRAAAPVLSLDDLRALEGALQPGTVVAGVRHAVVDVVADGRRAAGVLGGVSRSWRRVAEPDLASGRWISADDEQKRRRIAILGGPLARELFRGTNPVGERVLAGGTWFSVVGVLRSRAANTTSGPAVRTVDVDRAVLVPIGAMDISLGAGDETNRLLEIGIRTIGAPAVESSVRTVQAVLTRRNVEESNYELIVPRELLNARLRAQRKFNSILIGLGILALIISGVGIMNIMLASVAARVNEIGVRRAFGARRADIVAQFSIEAMSLCLAGGLAGIPLGAVFSAIVALVGGWPVVISPLAIAIALALAAGVGVGFGVYPACTAATIQPVDALRAS